MYILKILSISPPLLKEDAHPGDNKSRRESYCNVELIETHFSFDTLKLSPKKSNDYKKETNCSQKKADIFVFVLGTH